MPMTLLLIALPFPLLAEDSSQRPYSPSPAPRQANALPGRDLAHQVQTILSLKCAECHGARLARPKGKFGNVEDLKQLTGIPNLVRPFRPEDSKLWQLLWDNKMPPQGAKAGSLTAEQKNVIRAWIELGAPNGADAQTSDAITSTTDTNTDVTTEGADLPFLEHLLAWLGKFHVLVVHFPIALLVVAASGELWSLYCGIRRPLPAVRFCVFFAAAGGTAGTIFGWLHAAFSGYAASSSEALALHRWTGTTAGALAVCVAVVSEMDARCGMRSTLFRILLFLAALLVSIAGHLGGTLVYGDSYFNW
jgi:uncharacterized membrane protein